MNLTILFKFLRIYLRFIVRNVLCLLRIGNERSLFFFLISLRRSSLENASTLCIPEIKIYPKRPTPLYPFCNPSKNISILIQGPINDVSFVAETIRWYRKCGITKIFVSSDTLIPPEIQNLTDHIYCGGSLLDKISIWNENEHLRSVQYGLRFVNDSDIVLKTRSDQRIYDEIFLASLSTVFTAQTSKSTVDGFKLWVVSNNSSMSKINNLSDHLYIASGRALKDMFDIPFRDSGKILSQLRQFMGPMTLDEFRQTIGSSYFTELESEQWFFNSYRSKCLKIPLPSDFFLANHDFYIQQLVQYLNIVKESVYVIDPEHLGLFWQKSHITTLPSYYWSNKQNPYPIPFMRLTHNNFQRLLLDPDYVVEVAAYMATFVSTQSFF